MKRVVAEFFVKFTFPFFFLFFVLPSMRTDEAPTLVNANIRIFSIRSCYGWLGSDAAYSTQYRRSWTQNFGIDRFRFHNQTLTQSSLPLPSTG